AAHPVGPQLGPHLEGQEVGEVAAELGPQVVLLRGDGEVHGGSIAPGIMAPCAGAWWSSWCSWRPAPAVTTGLRAPRRPPRHPPRPPPRCPSRPPRSGARPCVGPSRSP